MPLKTSGGNSRNINPAYQYLRGDSGEPDYFVKNNFYGLWTHFFLLALSSKDNIRRTVDVVRRTYIYFWYLVSSRKDLYSENHLHPYLPLHNIIWYIFEMCILGFLFLQLVHAFACDDILSSSATTIKGFSVEYEW